MRAFLLTCVASSARTASSLLLLALLFSGCAATSNYHGNDGYFGGFSEQWQSDRSVTVHYGMKNVGTQEAMKNALLRASDLALQRGFTHFRVTDTNAEVNERRQSVSQTILTGQSVASRNSDVDVTVVMLDEAQAREMEAQGSAVVAARFFIEQNASQSVRRRILGN